MCPPSEPYVRPEDGARLDELARGNLNARFPAQVANELGVLRLPQGPVHLLAETLARTRAMAQVSDHHRRRRSSIDADPAQHRRPGVLIGPRQGEFRSLRLKA